MPRKKPVQQRQLPHGPNQAPPSGGSSGSQSYFNKKIESSPMITYMPRFGASTASTTSSLRTRDSLGLSDEQIQRVAPSVFAGGAHSSRSERYAYIPTSDVLAGLRREGFLPMEIRQGIDGNVSLNRALWVLAEEMAKLKA